MSDIAKRVIWSIVLSIPSAALGVILRGVFQAWGIFDPFSQWLGGWLKMHIAPVQIEWTVAAGIALLAYAGLLWIVWRYHRAPPIIMGDQAHFHGEVVGHPGAATKKQQREPPQRISLLELLSEAATKGWSFNRDTLQAFTQVLRQAASEGRVVIWGILIKNGHDPISAPSLHVTEKITSSYFKEHWIEAHQGWMHNENRYVITSLPSGKNEPNSYLDLHVERETALAWLDSIKR